MRRSLYVVALTLSLLLAGASPALADAPDNPGPWGSGVILCVIGFHLNMNGGHPTWSGWFCQKDHP